MVSMFHIIPCINAKHQILMKSRVLLKHKWLQQLIYRMSHTTTTETRDFSKVYATWCMKIGLIVHDSEIYHYTYSV